MRDGQRPTGRAEDMADEGFLNRWSRLKRDSQAPATAPVPQPAPQSAPAPAQQTSLAADADPAVTRAASSSTAAGAAPDRQEQGPVLPSIDELSLESDFSPFMRAEVDPAKRVSALKKLFSDPHFNRMDGLDVYIDDYTKPDPIPRTMLARLNQSRLLGLFEEEKPAEEASADAPAMAGEAMALEDTTDRAGEQAPAEGATSEGKAAEGTTAEGMTAEAAAAEDAAAEMPAAQGAAEEGIRENPQPDSRSTPRPDSPPQSRQAT
jgi:hypothetical protein